MLNLITYDGQECDFTCIGCDVYDGRVNLENSTLYEDEYWRIVQDTENPIVGFFVIGSKRHFRTFLEMNKEESRRLTPLLLETRRVMKEVLGIEKTTLIQEDGPESMHFHPWIFPWHEWMKSIKVDGKETDVIRKVMQHSREEESFRSAENINEINKAIKLAKESFNISFE